MSNYSTSTIRSASPPAIARKTAAKTIFKPVWVAITGLATLSFATISQPVQAFNISYDFTVQIDSDAYETQGLRKGATEQGSFTYDAAGLKPYFVDGNAGASATRNEFASPSQGNLTLTFNFLNHLYTEKDDLNYGSRVYVPDNPAALFSDGQLAGLDFLVVPSQLHPPKSAIGFRIYKNAFYFGTTDNSAEGSGVPVGTVKYAFPAPPPPGAGVAAVPEPSEVGGAIVAFSVLGVWAMRKAKVQRN